MGNIYNKLEQTIAKNRYTSYVHPPYELERKLVISIQQLDNSRSIEILKQINSLERAQLSKRPISSLKYSLIGSCTLFTRAVIEAGLDAETAFMLSDYYINLIDEANTLEDIQALEYNMLTDFIDVLRKHKNFTYNSMINKVISYIRKNIESSITLQELADLVNVHPNYLSAAFKKEVGKTLTEYINEIKISSIKLYMNHTNLSISEISDTFGFNHLTYFSRFFKKQTGLTPMEYKKQLSANNSNTILEDHF